MIDIRPITEKDYEQARLLIPSGCSEPEWAFCHVVEQDGRIVGLIGVTTRLVAEPLYMKKGANGAALVALGWIDGYARKIAQTVLFTGYEFFVSDEQSKEWLEFIENRLPVHAEVQKPGRYYFRSFNGKIVKPEASRSEQPCDSAAAVSCT